MQELVGNPWQQLILLQEVHVVGHLAATPPSVTSIWPGRCNNPANLPVIAAGLGTCQRGTTDLRPPKINTVCPSGGPCYPRGCQYCRLGIKEHFISVCDSKRERKKERECVSGVMEGVWGCPEWPVYIKPTTPQGRSQGDVPSLLTIDRQHDKLCRLLSLQCVVFCLNRMRGWMMAGLWAFFTSAPFYVVLILQLFAFMKGKMMCI